MGYLPSGKLQRSRKLRSIALARESLSSHSARMRLSSRSSASRAASLASCSFCWRRQPALWNSRRRTAAHPSSEEAIGEGELPLGIAQLCLAGSEGCASTLERLGSGRMRNLRRLGAGDSSGCSGSSLG